MDANIPTNHATIGPALMAVAYTLLPLSTVIVALRFYVKVFKTRRVTIDDWLMLVALIFEYIHTIFISVSYSWGLGHHLFSLGLEEATNASKYVFLSQMWAVGSSMIGRISFCIFLLGLLGPSSRTQRISLYAVIGFQVITNVPCIIQVYTQCGAHVAGNWDRTLHVTCVDPNIQTYFGYVQSAINSISDLALTVLPAIILWDLKMKRSLKVGLLSVLCLSIFAFAASVAKAVEIRNLGANNDFTYNMVHLLICLCIEENVVMMAASIPTLRPLLRRNGANTTVQYNDSPGNSNRLHNLKRSKGSDLSESTFASHSRSGTKGSIITSVFPLERSVSQEHILESGANADLGASNSAHPPRQQIQRNISKTMDVSVTYGEVDDDFEDARHKDNYPF